MPKNKRLSENALSWVKNTTIEAEKPAEPAKKAEPRAAKSRPAAESMTKSTGERFIFVKYDNNDGRIIATREILRADHQALDNPWTAIPEGKAVARLDLTGDLADKKLIDIHKNYKVVGTKNKPKLALKS